MARYIDADALYNKLYPLDLVDKKTYAINAKAVADAIAKTPTADVVARAEYNELWYKLEGVMHSVDKWLDGEELNQDEVNRAAAMREKTLRIVEGYQAQIRATIDFYEKRGKEIESICLSHVDRYNRYRIYSEDIDKLKKKYTEGGDQG